MGPVTLKLEGNKCIKLNEINGLPSSISHYMVKLLGVRSVKPGRTKESSVIDISDSEEGGYKWPGLSPRGNFRRIQKELMSSHEKLR